MYHTNQIHIYLITRLLNRKVITFLKQIVARLTLYNTSLYTTLYNTSFTSLSVNN